MGGGEAFTILALVAAAYMLPTLIALLRGRRNIVAIAALNLLLGWLVIGWVVALIWALSSSETVVVGAAAANGAPLTARNSKACPHCAERIQKAAKKCRYCGEAV